jgi:predicted anti-sigma-YlaC factor YlaD
MECKQYHKLISLYIDGALGILEEENLHKHLKQCKVCSIYMKNMLFLKDNIKTSYNQNVNVDFSKNIMQRIKKDKSKGKVVSLFNKKVVHTSLMKKSVSLLLFLIIFLLFSYFVNNQFSNENNIENLVIQHLDNSFLQEFPDIENVNLIQ